MYKNISKDFINFIWNIHICPYPQSIKDRIKWCFVDYIGVVLGGSKQNLELNNKYFIDNNIIGDFTILGCKKKANLNNSVMINAFNAHLLELDDSHRIAMTHLGAPIFSALIGVAEVYNCSLERMLHGAVVGYETAIRLANAIQPSHKKRGFHVTGTCCTVGSAVAVATMLEYSKKELWNVFSAACTSAGGLLAVISGDSEQKPYNVANAALAGVNAALYGKLFKGAVDILGDKRGFLRSFSDSYDVGKLFDGGYVMEGIYQKLYAACRHCHAPMEATLKLSNKNDLDWRSVASITVETYSLAIEGHNHTIIDGISSAKQSIPYGVAVALVFNDCGQKVFTKEKVKDTRLLSLVQKINVVENPELSRMVPYVRGAEVKIKLKSGEILAERVYYAKGEPENPITSAEMILKFRELAYSSGMSKEKALMIIDTIRSQDDICIRDLLDIIVA